MNRWFNAFSVDKPFIVKPENWLTLSNNTLWFTIICFIAAIFHTYQIMTLPIFMFGDEALHLQGGLWIYKYMDSNWHDYFQYLSWLLLILFIWKQQAIKQIFADLYSKFNSNKLVMNLSIIFVLCLLSGYFIFFSNLTHYPSLVRYPPLSRVLYLVSYFFLGIDHIGPRILQLVFYLLSAIYIYRIISLFSNKDHALLGASIYLFLPIVFFYAHTAELANGTNFFIITISYYCLRFIEGKDNRDLLLASYLIGIGFLYKRIILLMFFVCAAYLVIQKIKGKDIDLGCSLKALLISLVPIIPWMIIGKLFTWRNYQIIWPHLISIDRHAAYLLLIPTNISWIIFSLFLVAIIFVLKSKKNQSLIFFGFLFIGFYLFLVADSVPQSSRLSMALYPTISIYLSQFISGVTDKINWKHSFKMIYFILIFYLIAISSISPLNEKFYLEEKSKVEQYPTENALNWVNSNVKEREKILTLRILPVEFYRAKLGISKDRIIDIVYAPDDVSTPNELKLFCNINKISYIMFPYSTKPPKVIIRKVVVHKILMYLKENADNDFVEVARFNRGENYIYVYKLKN
jgi:hypothetical protein